MSTRTEQVLARKAAIDAERRSQTELHLSQHDLHVQNATNKSGEKAQHAREMESHASENQARKERQDAQKIETTLAELRQKEARATEVVESHRQEVAAHAAMTGTHPASLEGVQRREEEQAARRVELDQQLRRKSAHAEELKAGELESRKEKARAFEKPFEH
ncbi:hypothetical protein HKX48_009236 [Thoreauomyces humboldtii]|nr:hypothetical protein HKX48_009236 [Thoreauomyces humboldtii]